MLENINLALQGVWSHKLRSFLTMLGIIIGIAAIITIVSTIRGTNEQIKQNLIGAGNDMVQVQLTQDGSTVDFSYGELPEGIAAIGVRQRPLQKIELIRRSLRLLPDSGRSHGAADDQQHQSAKRQHDPSFPHGSRPPSASGQRTVNTAPPPGALAADTVPPRLCTVSCTMERPSPVPPAARERALSTR